MKLKPVIILIIVLKSLNGFGQANQIYIYNGSSGIGNSTVSGNVGIGISNPSCKLQINQGALKIGNGSDATSRSQNMLKIGDGDYVRIGEWEADDQLSFYANRFSFSSGFVNIKNTSASSAFSISDGTCNTVGRPRLILAQTASIPHAYIYYNQNLYFHSDGSSYNPLVLQYDGSVGIGFPEGYSSGATHTNGYKLAVNGSIHAKYIDVDNVNWPDYVFSTDYKLRSLYDLEKFITVNKHLPDIPSQETIAKTSVNLGDMQAKLLQKIEEMTLYLIEIKKENDLLKERITDLETNNK